MARTIQMISALFLASALPVQADYARIQNETDFVSLITGKTLTRPLVQLQVSQNGKISGKGATRQILGTWAWKNGYFCRSLEWGGDDLGYNCQEVKVSGSKIRFTSDQGAGDSAEFRLR